MEWLESPNFYQFVSGPYLIEATPKDAGGWRSSRDGKLIGSHSTLAEAQSACESHAKRYDFEREIVKEGFRDFDKSDDGAYVRIPTFHAWCGWQAAMEFMKRKEKAT